ncbi:hypothetical protein A2U01_0097205, partial [Trifolium medium]|nr:hypothetical protein [Trifolium medium]
PRGVESCDRTSLNPSGSLLSLKWQPSDWGHSGKPVIGATGCGNPVIGVTVANQ